MRMFVNIQAFLPTMQSQG